jgi:hypothetical protein
MFSFIQCVFFYTHINYHYYPQATVNPCHLATPHFFLIDATMLRVKDGISQANRMKMKKAEHILANYLN